MSCLPLKTPKKYSKWLFQLLHKVVDGICHRSKPNFEEFSQTWSLHDWWSLNDVYTDLFKKAVKESWTKDQVLKKIEIDCFLFLKTWIFFSTVVK